MPPMACVDMMHSSPLSEVLTTSSEKTIATGLCLDDAGLAILPKHTRVHITGNNRTKRTLVGQEAVVKKAVGLGGWHWLVLSNGEEVKLQRNALAVLEYGPEDQQESESDEQTDTRDTHIEILTRPRVRRPPRSLSPAPESAPPRRASYSGSRQVLLAAGHLRSVTPLSSSCGGTAAAAAAVATCPANLHRLETTSLKRYRRVNHMSPLDPCWSREELLASVHTHFRAMEVEETAVLGAFLAALCRRRTQGSS